MSLVYILVDFENVQPTAADVSLIRGADYRVSIFHGPHQTKFDAEMVKALQPLGIQVDYVKCERKGKNALDFHVAFCLGRLVQERESADSALHKETRFSIVSKDAGFDALLGHVRALGYGATRVESIREALSSDEPVDAAGAVEPTPVPVHTPTVAPALPSVATPTAAAASPVPAAAPAAKTTTPRPAEKATPSPKPPTTAKPAGPAKKAAPAEAAPAKKAAKKPAASPKTTAKPDIWSRLIANLREHPKNRPATRTALERYLSTSLGNGATPANVQALIGRLERDGVTKTTGGKIEWAVPKANK